MKSSWYFAFGLVGALIFAHPAHARAPVISNGFSCNVKSGNCTCKGGIDSADCKWMNDACRGQPTFCQPGKAKTCTCNTRPI